MRVRGKKSRNDPMSDWLRSVARLTLLGGRELERRTPPARPAWPGREDRAVSAILGADTLSGGRALWSRGYTAFLAATEGRTVRHCSGQDDAYTPRKWPD